MKIKINNLFTISALILALFIPAFAQDTKDDADSFYKLGRVYYDQGRYKEAEELFQAILRNPAKALGLLK